MIAFIENMSWLLIPILEASLLWTLFRNKSWFRVKMLYAVSLSLGLLGLIFAPTILCVSNCFKISFIFFISSLINGVSFIASSLLMYVINRKPMKN